MHCPSSAWSVKIGLLGQGDGDCLSLTHAFLGSTGPSRGIFEGSCQDHCNGSASGV